MHQNAAVLLLLSVLSVLTSAVQFGEPNLNTFERIDPVTGNATRWQSRTIEFTCDQNSHRSTTLRVGNEYYDVNCHPPAWLFNVRLVGFVTQKTRLYPSDVYIVDTTTRFSDNATVQAATGAASPTARRLLQLNFLSGVASAIGGPSSAGFQDFVCTNTMHMIDGDSCGGNGDGKTDPAVWRAIQNFTDKLNNWQKNVTNQFGLILAHEKEVDGSIQALQNITVKLKANQDMLVNATYIIGARLDNMTKQTHDQFEFLYNSTRVTEKYIDAEVNKLRNATNSNFRKMTDAVGQFRNLTFDQFGTIRTALSKLKRFGRELATTVYRARTNFDVRRKHSLQISALKSKCIADGGEPFLHPDFPGASPLEGTLTVAQKTVTVDQLKINWLNATFPAPQVVVHQHQLTFSCNHQALVDAEIQEIFWDDIPDLLMPGCTKKAGNIVDNCICWITIDHDDKCNRQGSFRWEQITTTSDPSAYKLQASMCSGSITQGPWNGRVIDNVADWHAYLGRVSDTDFSGSANTGLGFFQVVSAAMGPLGSVPSVRSPKLIPIQLQELMSTNEFDLTLPFAVYTFLQFGFARALARASDYERYIYGTLPNYLSCESIPNQYLSDGSTYELNRCSMLCINPRTQPVFAVTLDTVLPLVTATAYDGPPDCSGGTCSFAGRHIVSVEQSSSQQAFTPFDSLLPPTAGHVVVGEQFFAQSGFVYDVDEQTSISQVTENRRGQVTYLLQPIPVDYDFATTELGDYPPAAMVDGFVEFSGGFRPDHRAGVYSLDFTKTPLLGGASGARCDETAQAANWLCQLYDHFSTASDTDFKQGKWTLTPDQYSYSGSFDIVEGEIVQRVGDLCPEVDVVKYTDGSVEVTLSNSLPLPVVAFVRITTVPNSVAANSICLLNTGGDLRFDLEPKQKTVLRLPRCGRQTLTVFRLTTGDARAVCEPANVNITSDPLAAASVQRFQVGGTNSSFILDQVAIQSRALARQQTAELAIALQYLDPAFHIDLTYVERDLLFNQSFTDYLDSVYNHQQILNQLPPDSVTSLINDAFAGLADNNNAITILQTSLSDHIRVLEANLKQQQDGLDLLRKQSAELDAASKALIHQLQLEIDRINSRTEQSCEDGMPFFIRLIPGVAAIICWIKNAFIWIMVFVGIVLLICACCALGKWLQKWNAAQAKTKAAEARAERETKREEREDEQEERRIAAEDRAAKAAQHKALAASSGSSSSGGSGGSGKPDVSIPMTKAAGPAPAAGRAKYSRLPVDGGKRAGGWDSDED